MSCRLKKKSILSLSIAMIICLAMVACLTINNYFRVKAATGELITTDYINDGKMVDNYQKLLLPRASIENVYIQNEDGNPDTLSGLSPDNLFDGTEKVYWEHDWMLKHPVKYVDIDITLKNPEYFLGFAQSTRTDNNLDGTMSWFKIYTKADASADWSTEPVVEGNSPYVPGYHKCIFDKPVKLEKYVRMRTDAVYMKELQLFYMPSDDESIKKAADFANTLLDVAQGIQGYDEGYVRKEVYEKALSDKAVADALPATTDEERLIKSTALFNVVSTLKRGVLVSTNTVNEVFNEAKSLYNAAVVGKDPLYWDKGVYDEFGQEIKRAETILENTVGGVGDVEDIKAFFSKNNVIFKYNYIKPEIKNHGEFQPYMGDANTGINWAGLMDGTTANRFRIGNHASNYGMDKWIEFDYKSAVSFDSITIKTWQAAQNWSSIHRFKIEYLDEESQTYKPVNFLDGTDGEAGVCAPPWKTTATAVSEVYRAKFSQIKTSKFRFYFLNFTNQPGYAPNFLTTIDELEFGILVPETDVKIEISDANVEIKEFKNYQLKANITPFYLSNKNIIWKSENENIVKVDANGIITGGILPEGSESATTKVTATTEYGNKVAECNVTLKKGELSDKDKNEFIKKIEIEKKFLNASKKEDYKPNAIAEFKEAISKIEKEITNASLGQINQLSKQLTDARTKFDQQSLKSIKEIKDLISRITGIENYGDKFIIEFIPAIEVEKNVFKDVFEVAWKDGKPAIRGNTVGCIATAFNYYLKYYCYQQFPYTGSYTIKMPETLPVVSQTYTNVYQFDYRHYSNENCEYKYTVDNFTRKEWRHRLDWLAMNGFNMYLADFNFIIPYYYMAKDGALGEGFDANAMKELKSATYDYRVNFGNFELSDETVEAQAALARDVIKWGYAIGLNPEVRPFFGIIPFMFPNDRANYYGQFVSEFKIHLPNTIFDGMTAYTAARWMNLHQGLAFSPFVGDKGASEEEKAQAKEKYEVIDKLYYQYLMKSFGFDDIGETPKYFIKDLVHESGFIVSNAAYPNEMLAYVQDSISNCNPHGKFIMTSWRFQNWIMNYVDKSRLIFLDLDGFLFSRHQGTNEFAGTEWAFCVLHNYGGKPGVGGFVNKIQGLQSMFDEQKYLNGFGLTPEGGDSDPAHWEIFAELNWRTKSFDPYNWFKDYAKRRYGVEAYNKAKQEIDAVWDTLYKTAYSGTYKNHQGPDHTMIDNMPVLQDGWHCDSNASRKYALKDAVSVWDNMITAADKMGELRNDAFMYDYIDFSRQIFAEFSNGVFTQIMPSFQRADRVNLLKYGQYMIDIINDLDKLLNTNANFMIGGRLKNARARGITPEEQAYYESNERIFLTIWIPDRPGVNLNDYCSKHMGGIMKDYYGMRWTAFYNKLKEATEQPTMPTVAQFNNVYLNAMKQEIGPKAIEWTYQQITDNGYGVDPIGDTITVNKEIYNKWMPIIREFYGMSDVASAEDKNSLSVLYDNYKNIEKDPSWTNETWKIFQNSMEVVKAVMDKENATPLEVYNSKLYLTNAYSEMVASSGKVDKSQLNIQYEMVKNTERGKYSLVTWNAFQKALKEAKGVLDKADASSDEIESALSNLRTKFEGLEEEKEIILPPPDKTHIEALCDMFSYLNPKLYEKSSYDALINALNEARKVIANKDATNAEVNTARSNLESAYTALKYVREISGEEIIDSSLDKKGCGAALAITFENVGFVCILAVVFLFVLRNSKKAKFKK